jgi:hypothetical protein
MPFFSAAFKFFLHTGFEQCDYEMPWCSFLPVSFPWDSLSFLGSMGL